MKQGLGQISTSVRSRPMWLLVGIILLGVLMSAIRAPNLDGSTLSGQVFPSELHDLPAQLLASWLRMLAAYVLALLFAILIGTLAATNPVRGKILLPVLDILQSIPILGFFPTAIAWFVGAGGHRLGIEMACVFLIFTSQSWNLAFGVYDGIRSIPHETTEALESMGLGPLARFRRLYIPAVFPRLVDNSILSWSAGWYFLMACEIISLGPREFRLPGLGSYLSYAIEHQLWYNMFAGLAALITLILTMDVLIWKPLSALAAQFKFESTKQESGVSGTGLYLLNRYRNGKPFAPYRWVINLFYKLWVKIETFLETPTERGYQTARGWRWLNVFSFAVLWTSLIAGALMAALSLLGALIPPYEITPWTIFLSVLVSAMRIFFAYVLSILWILPTVYYLNKHPGLTRNFRSIAQVLASVPATAFFPLITLIALKLFGWNEVAVLLLLLTGMQWYLLFNVLGGAAALPNDLREVASSLGVKKSLYVKKVFLPSIIPALVTGSITAVGGGWNALIISEYFTLNGATHKVFGVGSILAQATYEKGNEKLMGLTLFVMVAFILVVNRFFWQRLYKWSEEKYRLEG